jgi:hypothetical protein
VRDRGPGGEDAVAVARTTPHPRPPWPGRLSRESTAWALGRGVYRTPCSSPCVAQRPWRVFQDRKARFFASLRMTVPRERHVSPTLVASRGAVAQLAERFAIARAVSLRAMLAGAGRRMGRRASRPQARWAPGRAGARTSARLVRAHLMLTRPETYCPAPESSDLSHASNSRKYFATRSTYAIVSR